MKEKKWLILSACYVGLLGDNPTPVGSGSVPRSFPGLLSRPGNDLSRILPSKKHPLSVPVLADMISPSSFPPNQHHA
jgi:hypothetical protein